jgi:hypothetical protein
MKHIKFTVGTLETTLSARELNLLRIALLNMQATKDPDLDTNNVINNLDFKIFRLQQIEEDEK